MGSASEEEKGISFRNICSEKSADLIFFFSFSFLKKKEKEEKKKIPEQNMQEANITKNLLHVIRPQALHINIAGAISRFHSWISYHDKWSVGVWNSYLSATNRGTSLGEKNGGFKSERQKKSILQDK